MADDLAIRIDNVGKLYRIGERERSHDSLVKAAVDAVLSPLRNYRRYRSLYRFEDVGKDVPTDVIWALKGVSFDVRPGEVVGIIGHNGAGKSTLLKILSRITPPTTGRIEVRGRISSLLEVGTGFHQELSGRENIYLNGTVLGMRKREVDARFDEIVAFSGVEKFLDTPVKRYSSGMRVRLAFSVAAHLEPEILIIDEVLAVGDAEFQRKCINKMEEVGQQGRTVLFVSHNMPAVVRLCSRGVLIDGGQVVADGTIQEVVDGYSNVRTITPAERAWEPGKAPGGELARLLRVRVTDASGRTRNGFDLTEPVTVEMEYEVMRRGCELLPHIYLYNEDGINLFGSLENDGRWRGREREPGRYTARVTIPGNYLAPGMFFINCNGMSLNPNVRQFAERSVIAFQVVDAMGEGTARGDWSGPFLGVVRPVLQWHIDYEPARWAQAAN